MKALSIIQPWASMIASGEKTIETRTYKTNYRGDILICASKTPNPNFSKDEMDKLPKGIALCLVRLVDCVPMTQVHEAAAKCQVYPKAWAWILEDVQRIVSVSVKGKLGLFDLPEGFTVEQYVPDDDGYCKECGAPLEWIGCWSCSGEGAYHDCGEDCCCCLEPDEDLNVQCDICKGEGGWMGCDLEHKEKEKTR